MQRRLVVCQYDDERPPYMIAGTPPLWTARALLSVAANKQPRGQMQSRVFWPEWHCPTCWWPRASWCFLQQDSDRREPHSRDYGHMAHATSMSVHSDRLRIIMRE